MTTTLSRSGTWTAELFASGHKPRVDREKCVVYGVRVTGPRSRNRHKYPPAYLNSLVRQLDGADCYWGHHQDPVTGQPVDPPPDAKLGLHRNPRLENGGVHTDLRYNPHCPHAEQFLWACENDPGMLSFSQLARVRWAAGRDADGDRVAEECLQLASVDVVCRGGATSTIFESDNRGGVAGTDVKAVAAELDTPGRVIGFLADLFGELRLDQAGRDQVAAALPAILGAAGNGSGGGTGGALDQALAAAHGATSAEALERHLAAAWSLAGRMPSGPGRAGAYDRLLSEQAALRGKFTAEARTRPPAAPAASVRRIVEAIAAGGDRPAVTGTPPPAPSRSTAALVKGMPDFGR